MHIETTRIQSDQNNNTIRQLSNIIRGPGPIIICYGENPPEYEGEIITYIDTPPKYEEPQSIVGVTQNVSNKDIINVVTINSTTINSTTINSTPKKTKLKLKAKQKNTENSISNRKGKCCYSKESDESRCCGVCYWLCRSNPTKERCECCPNTFCDYWKSGYIQTTEGFVRDEDRCRDCECDDCFCTVICFPFKFPVFFPCFLGSLFNEGINKLCGSNRNYLF